MSADNKTQIVISARDETAAAFASVKSGVEKLSHGFEQLRDLSIAGFSVDRLIESVKGIIDLGDEMGALSQRIGISVRDLGTWTLAANQSETSIEAVAKGVKGLGQYLITNGDALEKVGIDTRDANTALIQLADLFHDLPDSLSKTALATKLFGKAGIDLIPLLNKGSVELREAAEKAGEYGRRLELLAPLADQFNSQMHELGLQSKETGLSIATGILPGLIGMATWLSDIKSGGERAERALEWLSEKSPLGARLVQLHDLLNKAAALSGVGGDPSKQLSSGRIGGKAGLSDSEELALGSKNAKALEAERKALELLGKTSASAAAANAESSYLAGLRQQLNAAGGDISEYSRQMLTLTQGAGRDFSQQTKDQALALARQIDVLREATKANEDHAKVLEKVSKAEDAAVKAMEDFGFRQDQNVSGIAARTAALGKTPFEVQQAAAAQAIQKDYEEAVKRINEELGKIGDIEGIAAKTYQLAQVRDQSLAKTAAALDAEKSAQDALNASWEYGANTALRKYQDELENVAASTEQAMTRAFKGMEDALVSFVKTGKLDFRSLADSIVTDLIRIQVQQSIIKPISQGIQDSGGIGSLFSGAGSFVKNLFGFASGGSFTVGGDGGTDSQLVAFKATPGERVSIAPPGRQDSGGIVIQQHIYPAAGVSRAEVAQAMLAAKNAAIAEIRDNMRRGGVFA